MLCPASDFSLHPPPSLLPPKKYCDITGLEAPYRDPNTGLQYHSREVYEVIKTLVRLPSAANSISTGGRLTMLLHESASRRGPAVP